MPQAKKWHLSKLHVKVNFVSSIQHLHRKKKLNSIGKWLRNWNNISTTQRLWYCIWCAFASSFICETNLKWTLFVSIFWGRLSYKAFSHDVTAAILMFQNIEMAANKLVNQLISVNTWDGVAPIIRAGRSWMKRRCMTIKIVNDSKPFQ